MKNIFALNIKNISLFILTAFLAVSMFVIPSSAQVTKEDLQTQAFIDNAATRGVDEDQFGSLGNFMASLVNIVFFIGLAVALIFIIVCGIKYVTSAGDQQKAEEARGCITNAVIGAVIVVAFRVIFQLIISLVSGNNTDGLDEVL